MVTNPPHPPWSLRPSPPSVARSFLLVLLSVGRKRIFSKLLIFHFIEKQTFCCSSFLHFFFNFHYFTLQILQILLSSLQTRTNLLSNHSSPFLFILLSAFYSKLCVYPCELFLEKDLNLYIRFSLEVFLFL